MATGPLRFRTPHIEELPTTNSRQAPGFAWVAVSKNDDPAKAALEVTGKKRARTSGLGQSEAQKEALGVRHQKEIEKRIRDLNADNSKDVNIPIPKKEGAATGSQRAGKTPNTKKILASGKEFKHYLDDEEAELARTGRVDGLERDIDVEIAKQRASKTPIARRIQRESSTTNSSPAPATSGTSIKPPLLSKPDAFLDDEDDDDFTALAPSPTDAEMQVLLDAPPLTYNAARSAPPPSSAPPPRSFCEICGYWGRVKCMKCGARTCSVQCEDVHVSERCLKFYA